MHQSLLQHIESIVTLTDEEQDRTMSFFTSRKLRKHQFLVQETLPVHEMYFVESGLLKSSIIDESGKEHILQFATTDWWVSDFPAFFKRQSSTIAIQAIEASELYAISFDGFNKLCREIPNMEHFFRVKSNYGYVALQQRILSLLSKSAKLKYEEFLQIYPNLVNRIPKQYIASYIGVSRETLSRLNPS